MPARRVGRRRRARHRRELEWTPQPAQAGTYRAEFSWVGDAGTAAAITSALRGWNHLRFEVTEEPTAGTEGARFSSTPDLGVFHAVTGLHGDIMIPEDRLKAAVVKAALGETPWSSRSTSCSASRGTTSWRPSGTPATASPCAGCTRWSEPSSGPSSGQPSLDVADQVADLHELLGVLVVDPYVEGAR